jgi:tripartite motif-containing protein 71
MDLMLIILGELPDPNADAIMSRCNVCSEKAYVNPCAHCDKKVCDDCKEAHCDILKREISRLNNQVKRGYHRIEECVQQVDRNQQQLEQVCNWSLYLSSEKIFDYFLSRAAIIVSFFAMKHSVNYYLYE